VAAPRPIRRPPPPPPPRAAAAAAARAPRRRRRRARFKLKGRRARPAGRLLAPNVCCWPRAFTGRSPRATTVRPFSFSFSNSIRCWLLRLMRLMRRRAACVPALQLSA
jgi:hypothetical protein